MQRIDSSLITPIYAKTSDSAPPPPDAVYYLLASNHLFVCRNHPHYQSSAPAPLWPTELAPHAASLIANFPVIPQDQFEKICGFFGHMSDQCSAEAIVLLAWDNIDRTVHTIVPRQVSAISQAAYGAEPIGVKYQFPQNLPSHWTVFCDIHSHCEMAAYASQTDVDDEDKFSGLHLVVGRLHQEPPDFHAECVVDGTRFLLKFDELVAGYQYRDTFPRAWLDQVVVTNYKVFRDFRFEAAASTAKSESAPNGSQADGRGNV